MRAIFTPNARLQHSHDLREANTNEKQLSDREHPPTRLEAIIYSLHDSRSLLYCSRTAHKSLVFCFGQLNCKCLSVRLHGAEKWGLPRVY